MAQKADVLKYAALAIALLVLNSTAFAAETPWSGVELRKVSAAPALFFTRSLLLYAGLQESLAPSFDVTDRMDPGGATAALELRLSFRRGGLGLNWFRERHFVVKGSYAHKLGSDELTVAPDTAKRFWINAVKYY
jgi:hypothetical protein